MRMGAALSIERVVAIGRSVAIGCGVANGYSVSIGNNLATRRGVPISRLVLAYELCYQALRLYLVPRPFPNLVM